MQIIIEVENLHILRRLLDLLRVAEWLGGVRVWKKVREDANQELVYDFKPAPTPENKPELDYQEFYGIIQPQMGIETVDRLIAEMRED